MNGCFLVTTLATWLILTFMYVCMCTRTTCLQCVMYVCMCVVHVACTRSSTCIHVQVACSQYLYYSEKLLRLFLLAKICCTTSSVIVSLLLVPLIPPLPRFFLASSRGNCFSAFSSRPVAPPAVLLVVEAPDVSFADRRLRPVARVAAVAAALTADAATNSSAANTEIKHGFLKE